MKPPSNSLRAWLLAMAATALLSGCASNALYQWGGYDDQLYATYKDPGKAQAMRARLEAHIQKAEQEGSRVAPGLHAELGTLYLQAGDRGRAIAAYQKERRAWPESTVLMTAMIQNLERLEQQGQGAKQ